jgi:hypothetical protein
MQKWKRWRKISKLFLMHRSFESWIFSSSLIFSILSINDGQIIISNTSLNFYNWEIFTAISMNTELKNNCRFLYDIFGLLHWNSKFYTN